MYLRRVKRLLVDAEGRLAGVVSRADVLAVCDRPNAEVSDEVGNEVAQTVPRGLFDVRRERGRRRGHPDRQAGQLRSGHDIVIRAQQVHCVAAVRDRPDYPSPGPRARSTSWPASRRTGGGLQPPEDVLIPRHIPGERRFRSFRIERLRR